MQENQRTPPSRSLHAHPCTEFRPPCGRRLDPSASRGVAVPAVSCRGARPLPFRIRRHGGVDGDHGVVRGQEGDGRVPERHPRQRFLHLHATPTDRCRKNQDTSRGQAPKGSCEGKGAAGGPRRADPPQVELRGRVQPRVGGP